MVARTRLLLRMVVFLRPLRLLRLRLHFPRSDGHGFQVRRSLNSVVHLPPRIRNVDVRRRQNRRVALARSQRLVISAQMMPQFIVTVPTHSCLPRTATVHHRANRAPRPMMKKITPHPRTWPTRSITARRYLLSCLLLHRVRPVLLEPRLRRRRVPLLVPLPLPQIRRPAS
jgi:hypothetical protein